jgi:hypothetical protein
MKARNKMTRRPDPLIDEVRAIRKAIEDEVGGDLQKLAERANEAARKFRESRRPTRSGSKGKR